MALVYAAVDGPAMKAVPETWLDASDVDQPSLLAAAEVLREVDIAGFALWTLVLFGVAPLVYGVAVVVGDDHPRWLGYAAVAVGLVGIIQGLSTFFVGLIRPTVFVLTPIAAFGTTAWFVFVGLMLWRRRGTA